MDCHPAGAWTCFTGLPDYRLHCFTIHAVTSPARMPDRVSSRKVSIEHLLILRLGGPPRSNVESFPRERQGLSRRTPPAFRGNNAVVPLTDGAGVRSRARRSEAPLKGLRSIPVPVRRGKPAAASCVATAAAARLSPAVASCVATAAAARLSPAAASCVATAAAARLSPSVASCVATAAVKTPPPLAHRA